MTRLIQAIITVVITRLPGLTEDDFKQTAQHYDR
jgi:hypothetical protein